MNAVIEKTMKSLERNNMKAYYAENKAQVCEIVKGMLFPGAVITAGGSMSLNESGVWDIISDPEYKFLNRLKPGISEEERLEIFRAAIGCDFFFCSSNAVTENGELINVDGNANRVSSICFGPKMVVMVVGANKIVKDVDEGILRVKKTAAPMNTARLSVDAPCKKLGHCISLEKSENPKMTDGCCGSTRICCDYLVSAMQRVKDRINVIICGESLGY